MERPRAHSAAIIKESSRETDKAILASQEWERRVSAPSIGSAKWELLRSVDRLDLAQATLGRELNVSRLHKLDGFLRGRSALIVRLRDGVSSAESLQGETRREVQIAELRAVLSGGMKLEKPDFATTVMAGPLNSHDVALVRKYGFGYGCDSKLAANPDYSGTVDGAEMDPGQARELWQTYFPVVSERIAQENMDKAKMEEAQRKAEEQARFAVTTPIIEKLIQLAPRS